MRQLPLRISSCVIALLAASCGDNHPVGPSDLGSTDALISALQQQGATAVRGETLPRDSNPSFSTNAQIVRVNGGVTSVFEYPSVAAADRDAAKVSRDGSAVGSTMITWVGPPHFFKSGRLIVVYAGSDAAVLQPLEAVLGPPFAQR
jgi:hypothetical protein